VVVETVSLLSEIRNSGYEGAILTTYNLHIPFLEEVIIRRLHSSGCRHIIVLADQHQLAKAVHANTPQRAGFDYLLLPMPTRTAFHPKMVMLAGKSKGFLAVGSHNLTYSGFGHNREVTNAFYYDSKNRHENAVMFHEAWKVLRQWMESVRIDAESAPLLARLPQLAPWIVNEPGESNGDIQLLTGEPNETPLFDKMKSFVDGPLKDIFLTGPFFDGKLEFVSQLTNAFEPDVITIALDPDTAQIPASAKSLAKVSFVKANSLGPKKANYLHAKIICATGRDGTRYMLSGSANPSAPAWLRDDQRSNHEAMIALRGKEAQDAARCLGLPLGKDGAPLDQTDWDSVAVRWSLRSKTDANESKHCDIVFVSLAHDGFVNIPIEGELATPSVNFIGIDGAALHQQPKPGVTSDQTLRVALPQDQRISLVQILEDAELIRVAIVHYPSTLQEKAKTGVQKRFSSAFGSLDSGTPALNDLFKCIEQVISEDQPTEPKRLKSNSGQKPSNEKDAPTTLEISVEDILHGQKKRQLSAGTNLGYILDILIHSLGQDLISDYEDVDTFGRNEEEQIGSDDEETESKTKSRTKAMDVLAFCHRKIRQLVSRAEKQLNAFVDGKVSDRNVVIKLVAVIALFSQLRAKDEYIWWVNVDLGESTVPKKEMGRLMDAVAYTLLSHPLFMYEPKSDDEEVPNSDEYAKLRGLIFWLGAQSGVSLQLWPPFNEKIVDRTARIQANQNFLALSDLVAGDEVAAEAAIVAIEVTNIELRTILDRATSLRNTLNDKIAHPSESPEISAGDFAFNPKQMSLGVRAVLHADGRFVELASPGGATPKTFYTSSVVGISASDLAY